MPHSVRYVYCSGQRVQLVGMCSVNFQLVSRSWMSWVALGFCMPGPESLSTRIGGLGKCHARDAVTREGTVAAGAAPRHHDLLRIGELVAHQGHRGRHVLRAVVESVVGGIVLVVDDVVAGEHRAVAVRRIDHVPVVERVGRVVEVENADRAEQRIGRQLGERRGPAALIVPTRPAALQIQQHLVGGPVMHEHAVLAAAQADRLLGPPDRTGSRRTRDPASSRSG